MSFPHPLTNDLNLLQDTADPVFELGTTGQSDESPNVSVSSYFRWKPFFSRLLALALMVPAIPMLIVLAAIIRMTSSGKAIYAQKRVGKNGKVFTMYKLRTMRDNAEAETGPIWATDDDVRVTRVGAFLRQHHLDELPQLLNVIKGEMDIFGPRPERPEFAKILSEKIPGYDDRHLVLPGITGLAQVHLPPDTDINSVCRKLRLDLEYINQGSLLLDVRMFFKTVLRLIVGK